MLLSTGRQAVFLIVMLVACATSLDRQRNVVRFACPEPNCAETGSETTETGQTRRLMTLWPSDSDRID